MGKVYECTENKGIMHFASAFSVGGYYETKTHPDGLVVIECDTDIEYPFNIKTGELIDMDLSFEFKPSFELISK